MQAGNHGLGRCLLGFIVIINRRAILGSHVMPLAVQRRRVMNGEKRRQQRLVTDDRRIEADLHHLGVSGITPANGLVGRTRIMPAHVTGQNGNHTIELLEGSLEAPEATTGPAWLRNVGMRALLSGYCRNTARTPGKAASSPTRPQRVRQPADVVPPAPDADARPEPWPSNVGQGRRWHRQTAADLPPVRRSGEWTP